MSINVIAVKETRHKKYLLNSPCYSIWVFADEDPSHTATEYKCHFAGYKVFPNEKLCALLCQQPNGGIGYLSVVEDSFPSGGNIIVDWTHSEMMTAWDVDRDRGKTLIRLKEIDWEALAESEADVHVTHSFEDLLQGEIESAFELGYPDIDRLRLLSEGKTVYGFSEHDFRYIKGCPDITVERPPSGGLHLSHLDESNNYHKQRYFFHTESQARQSFWEYLQKQGVKPEEEQ